jgi:hypothetical protein
VNEVVDRIEQALMDAARRRSRRRHRRAVLSVVAVALLLLGSGASAVTGVGPLGDALTADEELPSGAKPAAGGESVTLAGETADGRRQEVRVYRRKPHRSDLSGAHHYCAASYSADSTGKRDPVSIHCTLGTKLAAKLVKRGLWVECSGRGGVVGQPAPPDPVCGLTLATTHRVTIEPSRGSAGPVKLSRPFLLRVDRDPQVVEREGGIERAVAERLPAVLGVRAILGVVDAPPTKPGQRTPLVRVTATTPDGTLSAHVGGTRLMVSEDVPSMDPTPEPGGPRATLTTRGPGGESWTVKAWRTTHADHCASAVPTRGRPPRDPSIYCFWRAELGRYRSLARGEALGMFTRAGPRDAPRSYAVYGFLRADVDRVEIRAPGGSIHPAELSPAWTTFRRRRGDLLPIPPKYRDRFAGLPQSLRIRVFQAVVPASAAPDDGRPIVILTARNGSVAESHPFRTPREGATSLTLPP